jgi:hypothetical protein
MPYFDERSIYEEKRRGSRRLLTIILLSAALLIGAVHYALSAGVKEGDVAQATVAICGTKAEANQVLDHLAKGGQDEAIAYIMQPDNTCDLDEFTFVVGPTVGVAKKDPSGIEWTVIAVHPPPNPSQTDYAVVRTSALQLTSY